jgi:hypothetical protein
MKGKAICDQCASGYILASNEVSCEQSDSNCQALDSNIQGQCWSCNEGFMVSTHDPGSLRKGVKRKTGFKRFLRLNLIGVCVINSGQVKYC